MDGIYLETFEIRDEKIDVEEIMRKIKENVRAHKQHGNGAPHDVHPSDTKDLQGELDQISSLCDIRNRTYAISSHRPIVGKVLVKGRQAVNGEICRYVDPMVSRQVEFNSSVVNILNETTKKVDELIGVKIEALREEFDGKLKDNLDQIRAVVESMNEEVENRAWLVRLLNERIDCARANLNASKIILEKDQGLNYFLFEERFRGSRIDIKQRQSAFLQFFMGCKSVLDIGCGRGEFLELMQEQGIGALGIDLDEDMVSYCKSKRLMAEVIDAISYLEQIEDKSLDGIFIDQVVEHLEPNYLILMLKLCHQKLIYGGHIIAETVNPLSFFSSANFYLDMSHKKPIHPETLKFLLGFVGFRDIETRFFSPVPDDIRLKKIDTEGSGEKDRKRIEIYNHNIDMLNTILYGAQDYAAIGKK